MIQAVMTLVFFMDGSFKEMEWKVLHPDHLAACTAKPVRTDTGPAWSMVCVDTEENPVTWKILSGGVEI